MDPEPHQADTDPHNWFSLIYSPSRSNIIHLAHDAGGLEGGHGGILLVLGAVAGLLLGLRGLLSRLLLRLDLLLTTRHS